MADLRLIGPSGAGRWIWPFREMRIGDFFHVELQDRPLREVRTIAYSRGYQLGMKFSVTKADGLARVERIDPENRAERKTAAFIDYGNGRSRLKTLYRLSEKDVDSLPWSFLDVGQSWWHKGGRYGAVKRKDMIVDVQPGSRRVHVGIEDDGFMMTRLEDGTTLQGFLAAREDAKLLELMS